MHLPPKHERWATLQDSDLDKKGYPPITGWCGVTGTSLALVWDSDWGYQGKDGTFICPPKNFITHYREE